MTSEPQQPEPWRGERQPSEEEREWWERVIDGVDPAEQRGINGHSEPDPDEPPEEFVPPEPPPWPTIAPPTVLGAAGLISGLILVLAPRWLANILAVDVTIVMVLGIIILLSGVVALVYRLREADPEDDDELPPDNGAVV